MEVPLDEAGRAVANAFASRSADAVGHVRDAENPTDFLTKWTTKAKLAASVEYLTNQRAWNQRRA